MDSPDLVDLMARVSLGDRQAFAELYRRTSAKLFGVCLRILSDRRQAEEVLQETYIRIWRSAATYDPQNARPITWMVAVARHRSIDLLRARKSSDQELEAAVELADPGPDPEDSAVKSGEYRRIENCLDELDPLKADAVRRAYLVGASYQELADHFGIPLNTVRTWLRRSLQRLRECLER